MADAARRFWLLRSSAALAGLSLGILGLRGLAQPSERVIKVTAHKFTYSPDEIMLKKGEPVVLEMTSLDVHMGFKCPDLGLRADVFPDKVTRVPLNTDQAGSFDFYCDVFCGDDHENMTGTIVIKE